MEDRITLDRLRDGESFAVEQLVGEETAVRRLEDLGLTVGTRVCLWLESPLGDPRAYRIRGTVIALRREDAAMVMGRRDENGRDA